MNFWYIVYFAATVIPTYIAIELGAPRLGRVIALAGKWYITASIDFWPRQTTVKDERMMWLHDWDDQLPKQNFREDVVRPQGVKNGVLSA